MHPQRISRDFCDITNKLAVACFYGETPYGGQIECTQNGIDILVGTPGRIKDHLQNGKLDLTRLEHVVPDEDDQMLEEIRLIEMKNVICRALNTTHLSSSFCSFYTYIVLQ